MILLLLTVATGKHASVKNVLPVALLKTVFLCIKHRATCQAVPAEPC